MSVNSVNCFICQWPLTAFSRKTIKSNAIISLVEASKKKNDNLYLAIGRLSTVDVHRWCSRTYLDPKRVADAARQHNAARQRGSSCWLHPLSPLTCAWIEGWPYVLPPPDLCLADRSKQDMILGYAVQTLLFDIEWVHALGIQLKMDWQGCKKVLSCKILHFIGRWD